MRKFGTDAPEFFVFQLEGDDTVYKIPLAASMTNRQIAEFDQTNSNYSKQVEWLRGFIGDIVDDLTGSDTRAILQEWLTKSAETGASVGESEALSDS